MASIRFSLIAFVLIFFAVSQVSAQDLSTNLIASPLELAQSFVQDTTLATPSSDSIQTDVVLNPCLPPDPDMPIYKPDTTLTESMPVIGKESKLTMPNLLTPCVPASAADSLRLKEPAPDNDE